MASNYTSNYGLCQWAASDKVLRTEFNADNAKIDAAIAAVDSRVDGKASTSSLSSLKSTVDGLSSSKADLSALNSLKNTVSGLSATVSTQGDTLARKGNCQVELSTYTGNGNNTRTHTFTRKPLLVIIVGGSYITALQGAQYAAYCGSSNYIPDASWSGNSLTLSYSGSETSNRSLVIGNVYNQTYRMLVFFDMSA